MYKNVCLLNCNGSETSWKLSLIDVAVYVFITRKCSHENKPKFTAKYDGSGSKLKINANYIRALIHYSYNATVKHLIGASCSSARHPQYKGGFNSLGHRFLLFITALNSYLWLSNDIDIIIIIKIVFISVEDSFYYEQ